MIWESVLGEQRIHIIQRSQRRLGHVVCPCPTTSSETTSSSLHRRRSSARLCHICHGTGIPQPTKGAFANKVMLLGLALTCRQMYGREYFPNPSPIHPYRIPYKVYPCIRTTPHARLTYSPSNTLEQLPRIHLPPLFPPHLRIQQPLDPPLSPPNHPRRTLAVNPHRRTPLVVPRPQTSQPRFRPHRLRLRRPNPVARNLHSAFSTAPAEFRPRAGKYLVLRTGRESSRVPRTFERTACETL